MAARRYRVNLQKTCGVCWKLWTRHKKLPCRHSFCDWCLQSFAGDRVAFPCPVCRQLIELPPGGISRLPNNDHKFHILVGELSDPTGIAVSRKPPVYCGEIQTDPTQIQNIFVAAYDKQYIQVFSSRAVYYFQTIVPGDDRQKIYPEDIALDGEENLWFVGNVDPVEGPGFAVRYRKYIYPGRGREQVLQCHFKLPRSRHLRGVAVDTERNKILVTHRDMNIEMEPTGAVHVYSPDGTLVNTVCQQGMNFPQYITVDGEGRILVTDKESHSVYVFNQDGQFLFQFGRERLKDPRGICTDSSGNIIVADHGTGHVEMFDRLGTCTFLHHSCIAINIRPQAVAISPQGHLVVADNVGNELTIFPKKNKKT